jgi:hypothetical protein
LLRECFWLIVIAEEWSMERQRRALVRRTSKTSSVQSANV